MIISIHFLILSYSILLRMKNFSDKCLEKIKTPLLSYFFFFFENLAFYGIMWKNIVDPGRPQVKIWRMRISCWITKASVV